MGEVEKAPESEVSSTTSRVLRDLSAHDPCAVQVRLSAAGMQGEANSDPDSSALGFVPSGLAASYPSPAESDGVIGGDGGRADDEDESTPRALWSRELANEYSPHPCDTPDTDLPKVPIPTSPLSASPDAAKSVATGPPPPTPSADRGLNLSADVSDPRLHNWAYLPPSHQTHTPRPLRDPPHPRMRLRKRFRRTRIRISREDSRPYCAA